MSQHAILCINKSTSEVTLHSIMYSKDAAAAHARWRAADKTPDGRIRGDHYTYIVVPYDMASNTVSVNWCQD